MLVKLLSIKVKKNQCSCVTFDSSLLQIDRDSEVADI